MKTYDLQTLNRFDIGILGMQTMIHLMDVRVAYDLGLMQKKVLALQSQLKERETNGKAWYSIKSNDSMQKDISNLIKEMELKLKWFDRWKNNALSTLREIREKHSQTPQSDFSLDTAKRSLGIKAFLVIQETIFFPIYCLLDGTPSDVQEIDPKGAAANVSKAFGFAETQGQIIYSDTQKFFRTAAGYWKKVIGWSLGGSLIAAATAGFAAPFIAASVGGLMGLSGAAATSAGLAFFGGGSIAAGGAGMAGGIMVLVGGGGLLGAGAGLGAANLLNASNKEMVVVTCAKVLNYANYLTAEANSRGGLSVSAKLGLVGLKGDFLNFKNKLEKDLLLPSEPLTKYQIKQGMEQVKVLELALVELVKA